MDKTLLRREKAIYRDSFVIRVWREADQPGWQGWIQHARTGKSAYVRDINELAEFIERHTSKTTHPKQGGLQ